MAQSSVVWPRACSARASSANASRRPAVTSSSISRSQTCQSCPTNHARNAASFGSESCYFLFEGFEVSSWFSEAGSRDIPPSNGLRISTASWTACWIVAHTVMAARPMLRCAGGNTLCHRQIPPHSDPSRPSASCIHTHENPSATSRSEACALPPDDGRDSRQHRDAVLVTLCRSASPLTRWKSQRELKFVHVTSAGAPLSCATGYLRRRQ